MKKSQLIDKLYTSFYGLGQENAHTIVNLILEKMVETLLNKEPIEIRGFGRFSLKYHAPRSAHNPKTGKKLIAKEKYSICFKPGKALKDAVNQARLKNIPSGRVMENPPEVQ